MGDTDLDGLGALLPMHLLVAEGGAIRSAGSTLAKLIGGHDRFETCLAPVHLHGMPEGFAHLAPRIRAGQRLTLRLRDHPAILLRGHGVPWDGGFLMNLGFGITLAQAIRSFSLTDADFAPADLAMEFLFLHEANQAVLAELGRANRRLEAAFEAAETRSMTDPLTGLLNRRGLELALQAAWRNAGAVPFALAQLDLDFFKQVNDIHGHAAGDDVLRHVAQILRTETRSADRVARTGGDEFLLLLMRPGGAEQLLGLSRRIIRRIEEPIPAGDALCRVSASLGFVRSAEHALADPDAMLAAADAALYEAKRAGRGMARAASPG